MTNIQKRKMKRTELLCLIFISATFGSCEFNQSVNKELTTGAYSRGDEIACDDVNIQINGDVDNRNEFVYGEKIDFIFNNITGLKRENGRAFPGLSMFIINSDNDTVLQHQDLFADLENGTNLSPLQLQASFTSTLPHQHNEKYSVFINLWDKKGLGTFQYELPFSIKRNELLNIHSLKIDYSNIYLWDENKKSVIVQNKINAKSTLTIVLEGIDGLEVVNNKVFPSFSIDLADSNGHPILSNANILEEYRETGVDYNIFRDSQLPITITFTSGQINNPCKLKACLKDLNSERNLVITSELEID